MGAASPPSVVLGGLPGWGSLDTGVGWGPPEAEIQLDPSAVMRMRGKTGLKPNSAALLGFRLMSGRFGFPLATFLGSGIISCKKDPTSTQIRREWTL